MTEREFMLSKLSPAEREDAARLGIQLPAPRPHRKRKARVQYFTVDLSRRKGRRLAKTSSVIRKHRPEVA